MINPGDKLLTVCELGRVGDIVASEPIFRYLKQKYPDRKLCWYTKDSFTELLRYSPSVDEIFTVHDSAEYLELKSHFPAGTISYELNFRHGSSSANTRTPRVTHNGTTPSLLEKFAAAAGLDVPEETPKFWFRPDLKIKNLPEKYVVCHCASNGLHRQWSKRKWNALVRMFLDMNIPVVEIGVHSILNHADPLCIDRTGKMDLQELAGIIKGAQLMVGIESGFAHIANAVGTNAIVLTGKLRDFPEYNYYSGNFREGRGCALVRFYDVPCDKLPFLSG